MFDKDEAMDSWKRIEAETKEKENLKKQQNSFDKVFFSQLDIIDQEIDKQKKLKVTLVESVLQQMLDNSTFLQELFEENYDSIKAKVKAIDKGLNISDTISNIESIFPIRNDGNGFIAEDCPNVTEDWIIECNSTSDTINWSINPIDNSERYPQDPEDNPCGFNYVMPLSVYEASLKDKDNVLTHYFHEVVEAQLLLLTQEIEAKKIKAAQAKENKLSQTIESIDFNDPLVVAELKKKLKM